MAPIGDFHFLSSVRQGLRPHTTTNQAVIEKIA
jgi:hypothetical protein